MRRRNDLQCKYYCAAGGRARGGRGKAAGSGGCRTSVGKTGWCYT